MHCLPVQVQLLPRGSHRTSGIPLPLAVVPLPLKLLLALAV